MPSNFNLCQRFPAKARQINTSLQRSVQKSVCHSLFSWKLRASLMPRASSCEQSSWPQPFLSVAEHLCPHSTTRLHYGSAGRDRWPWAKAAASGTHPPSWFMYTHGIFSWRQGCQTGIWGQAQFRGGSDIVLIPAKHPECSQPTQMFYLLYINMHYWNTTRRPGTI